MPSLIAYLRASSDNAVHSLKLPDAPKGQQAGQELCTLPDGRTIVALFDGFTLPPDQPAEIAASIKVLTLTAALKDQIKAASPHVALISKQVIQKIRDKCTQDDEMYFARISIGALTGQYVMEPGEQAAVAAYGAFIESARQWGRAERAKLGL